MTAPRTALIGGTLALLVLLGTTRPAAAYSAPRRPAPLVVRPHHMPGWDWWRIYPWSPYNYGRNPYNPAILPYLGYVYPYYPYQVPTPPPAIPTTPALPTASGPLATPPPGTAMLRVTIPDTWGEVAFDGYDSITSGKIRYFVTPRLTNEGQTYSVSATFVLNRLPVTRTKTVHVVPGQTTTVRFDR